MSETTTEDRMSTSQDTGKIEKSEEAWRAELTPDEYAVMRQAGTERAFTGEYWNTKTPGAYLCRACGAELFSSDTKFDSGSGWPSFHEPVSHEAVTRRMDSSHGMVRTEATCARCDAHLGHVFPDGPQPTGDRYCMNSLSLKLDTHD